MMLTLAEKKEIVEARGEKGWLTHDEVLDLIETIERLQADKEIAYRDAHLMGIENAKLREASTVILDWAKDRVFVGYEASMFVKLQEAVATQEKG